MTSQISKHTKMPGMHQHRHLVWQQTCSNFLLPNQSFNGQTLFTSLSSQALLAGQMILQEIISKLLLLNNLIIHCLVEHGHLSTSHSSNKPILLINSGQISFWTALTKSGLSSSVSSNGRATWQNNN